MTQSCLFLPLPASRPRQAPNTVSLGSCGITQSSSSPSPLPLLWNGAHLFGKKR
ncbi:unnamed protein product, partial [Closterium sp. NIES-65]